MHHHLVAVVILSIRIGKPSVQVSPHRDLIVDRTKNDDRCGRLTNLLDPGFPYLVLKSGFDDDGNIAFEMVFNDLEKQIGG